MSKYNVGCGLAGIYAGVLKPNGIEWKDKSEVTHEAVCAVAQYLLSNAKAFRFKSEGKEYVLQIKGVTQNG